MHLLVIVSPSEFHLVSNLAIGLVDNGWAEIFLWCGTMEPVHNCFGAPLGYPCTWMVSKPAIIVTRTDRVIIMQWLVDDTSPSVDFYTATYGWLRQREREMTLNITRIVLLSFDPIGRKRTTSRPPTKKEHEETFQMTGESFDYCSRYRVFHGDDQKAAIFAAREAEEGEKIIPPDFSCT